MTQCSSLLYWSYFYPPVVVVTLIILQETNLLSLFRDGRKVVPVSFSRCLHSIQWYRPWLIIVKIFLGKGVLIGITKASGLFLERQERFLIPEWCALTMAILPPMKSVYYYLRYRFHSSIHIYIILVDEIICAFLVGEILDKRQAIFRGEITAFVSKNTSTTEVISNSPKRKICYTVEGVVVYLLCFFVY